MSRVPLVKTEGFDLQSCIHFLEENSGLARIKSRVNLKNELAGVAAYFEGREVVLFEHAGEGQSPVLVGMYWNRKNLASIFGCQLERLPFLLSEAVSAWQQKPVHPVVTMNSPANQITMDIPDLSILPVPTHALEDGGPYFSCSVVIARDPDTGIRNASINRIMVTGKDRLTMLMDVGRHLRDYYERAEIQGRPLEITINNGVDPTVYLAAVVPAAAAPIDKDELGIASALLGRPLELVSSRTVEVEGVANAQFIIEGEILPEIREDEGPFGEVTGYYGKRDRRWVVQVKSISHRRKPIFQTLLPGKEVYNSVGLMGEANIYNLVSRQVPGIKAVYLTHGGCGFYHAVVQMKKVYEGTQRNAMMATFAAFPSLKQVTVVDEDVDIYNQDDVEWAMATRFNPKTGVISVSDAFGHELNPITENGLTTKIGFDATAPLSRLEKFQRVKMMPVDINKYDIK